MLVRTVIWLGLIIEATGEALPNGFWRLLVWHLLHVLAPNHQAVGPSRITGNQRHQLTLSLVDYLHVGRRDKLADRHLVLIDRFGVGQIDALA